MNSLLVTISFHLLIHLGKQEREDEEEEEVEEF